MQRRNSIWLTALAAAAALAGAGPALGAAFTNGSFETGPSFSGGFTNLGTGTTTITGWTVTSGNIDYIGNYWTAEDGSRSLDMNGNQPGAIAQTFDTVLGRQYTVTFWIAGNPDCGPTIKHLQVTATGNSTGYYTFDISSHSTTSMGWTAVTYTFVATGASTTLTFQSTDTGSSCGPALDNVSIAEVPTIPALSGSTATAFALLLAALGWMAIARRTTV